MKICKVEGCDNKILAKGFCNRHYIQMYRYEKILQRTLQDQNKIINCGDYCEICLYNRAERGKKQREVARTKIDKNDLKEVKQYKWCLNGRGYVIAHYKNKKIYLHQFILGKKKGYEIDHKNINPLDNRKQNLRFITHQRNCMNTKALDICWHKLAKKWMARITINYKSIYLGLFINKEEAINASKNAKLKYFNS